MAKCNVAWLIIYCGYSRQCRNAAACLAGGCVAALGGAKGGALCRSGGVKLKYNVESKARKVSYGRK
jgi:hypothetical protein